MKRLLLAATLATSVWAADYASMSTQQLASMRGSVPVEDRSAFQQEMQKRMQSMSPQERQQMMQGRGQGQMMRGQGQGGGMMGRNMPTYESFDLNQDGKVSAKEFDDARTQRMTEQAASGKMMRNAANAPAFSDIDSNKDGFMSQAEFQAHQQQHRMQMQGQGKQ